jgi:uncharacterized sporulation protein YeaH/YhbH (DUF444 family)
MDKDTPAYMPRMSVSHHDWSLHRKGPMDQQRHKERIKEAIKQNLPNIVSEENIILSDGQHIIKVPIRSLDEYRFKYDENSGKHAGSGDGDSQVGDVIGRAGNGQGQGPGKGKGPAGEQPGVDYYEAEVSVDEIAALIFEDLGLPNLQEKRLQQIESPAIRFTDVRKKGAMSNLDKRRSLMENLKRNAAKGNPHVGDFVQDDLRFKTWETRVEYQSNAVVLAMMDVSGCCAAGHLIEMANGSYKDISQITEGDRVACVDLETYQKTSSYVTTTFRKRAPRTLLIESQDATIQATPEHRFFAYDEATNIIVEKHAHELAVGDKLILVNSWGKTPKGAGDWDQTLTPDQAYLIGVILGDGNLRRSTRAGGSRTHSGLSITDENLDRLQDYQQLFLSAFGVRGIIKSKYSNNSRQRLNINRSALASSFARRYPMLTQRSRQRYIDHAIYSEPPNVRAAFLRGLFDAEGTLGHHTVQLISGSGLLVKQIKHLLSYWGIRARITRKMQGTSRFGDGKEIKAGPYYLLSVNSKDSILFSQAIGFGCKEKARKLDALVSRQAIGTDAMRSKFIMPFDWRDRFDHLYKTTRTYAYYHPAVHALSHSQLQTIHSDAKATLMDRVDIQQVLDSQLIVSKVKAISSIEEEVEVYDFEVAFHHNYIVDGILSHNSMGEFEKYIARSFYFWMVRFLRTKYSNVEIVFISHHTEAREVTEEEFFHKGESGGTQVSSAYSLAMDIVRARYPTTDWNIYPFHFSDGDNLPWDNDLCVDLVKDMLAASNLFGYGEIREGYRGASSTLMSAFGKIEDPKFVSVTISDKSAVYPALKKFFSNSPVKEVAEAPDG